MMLACRIVLIAFAAAYLFALAILGTGTFGWLGQERDPLSGIYLIPLGLPWNRFLDAFPDASWPWLAAVAPALNLLLIWLVCRFVARSPGRF